MFCSRKFTLATIQQIVDRSCTLSEICPKWDSVQNKNVLKFLQVMYLEAGSFVRNFYNVLLYCVLRATPSNILFFFACSGVSLAFSEFYLISVWKRVLKLQTLHFNMIFTCTSFPCKSNKFILIWNVSHKNSFWIKGKTKSELVY